jgi:hypothetical protein
LFVVLATGKANGGAGGICHHPDCSLCRARRDANTKGTEP